MNQWKVAFVSLMLTAAVSCAHAASEPDYWWRPFHTNQGLNDALGAYGLSTHQLDEHPEESLRLSSDVTSPLYWVRRTVRTYGQAVAGRYRIPVTEDHASGRNRTAGFGRMADFFTQTWAEAGERIALTIQGMPPHGVTCSVQTNTAFGAMKGMVDLRPNEKIDYVAPEAGTIVLGCRDSTRLLPTFGSDVTIDVAGGKVYPMFIFGLTPFADWKDRLSKSPNPINEVYMFGGRTRFDVPAAKAASAASMDLGRFFREHLGITLVYDRVNGLDALGGTLDFPSQSQINATYADCCSASNAQGAIRIGFSGHPARPTYWGDWHEYGHQYQMEWSWDGLIEVSVNLYSISACRPLRGKVPVRECQDDKDFGALTWDPEAVGTFIASGEQRHFDGPDTGGDFARAVLFANLSFSFPDLFPQLGREFRKQWSYGSGSAQFDTNQKKKDWFVIQTSRLAGRDLTGFFRQWGLYFTPEAEEQVHSLGLPGPIIPAARYTSSLHADGADANVVGNITHEGATSVGFITYSTSQGPIHLVPDSPAGGFATVTVAVHDAQLHPAQLKLRAQVAHGECAWRAMNSANPCGGTHQLEWKMMFLRSDNPYLPPGHYTGDIDLALRSLLPERAAWGEVLHIDLDVTP